MRLQALALCGAGNTRKFLSLCAANPAAANSYTFFAAGDNDEAGRRMNAAVREGLAELGISCGAVEWPEGAKDANELLLRDPDALHAALDAAANADQYEYERKNAASAVGELLDLSVKRASRSAVPTGFPALDDLLDGGLYAGLYIIGAISSLGKTSYLLQIADSIAAAGSDVLYFSLEMSKLELMAKSISRISYRLDPSAERSDAFTARQVLRLDLGMDERRAALLSAAVEAYKKTGERLYYKEGLMDIGVQEVRAAVREHIRLRGRRPVVFVDYLQILKPSDPRATDKQNTDRAVVELKRISRDFDIPVLRGQQLQPRKLPQRRVDGGVQGVGRGRVLVRRALRAPAGRGGGAGLRRERRQGAQPARRRARHAQEPQRRALREDRVRLQREVQLFRRRQADIEVNMPDHAVTFWSQFFLTLHI